MADDSGSDPDPPADLAGAHVRGEGSVNRWTVYFLVLMSGVAGIFAYSLYLIWRG